MEVLEPASARNVRHRVIGQALMGVESDSSAVGSPKADVRSGLRTACADTAHTTAESLIGRGCAVMVRENLRFATGTRLPSIRLPALQKPRSEIFRPCRCPSVDNSRRHECAFLDFRLVGYDIARSDAPVQPDKLLIGLLGGWKFCNLLKRHNYA